MTHTRTRLMAAVAAFVVMGALTGGCDGKDEPGARNAAQAARPSRTATPSAHEKKAHEKRHRHRQKAHHRHHPKAHHHAKPTHRTATPHRTTRPAPRPSAPAAGTAVEARVVKLVNAQRAKNGCGPLRIDKRLREAAYLHSRDMGLHHYFDHDSRNGRTPWDRIKAQGYLWPSAENIAAGQATPGSVMDAWMHSAGHRANILNCSYKAIGVGVWKGSGAPIWTQDFGFK